MDTKVTTENEKSAETLLHYALMLPNYCKLGNFW